MARHKSTYAGERFTAFYGTKSTPEGRRAVEMHAANAGLSVSDYVRMVAEKKPRRASQAGRDPALIRALLRELQAEGNNLNQLALVANSRRQIEAAADLKELKARLIVLWDKVLAL